MCSVCHVFGHSNVQCAKKASTSSSLSKVEVQNENVIRVGNGVSSLPQQPDKQEWVQVRNGKQKVVQDLPNKGETDLIMSIPGVSGAQYSLSDGISGLVEQVQSDSDEELLEVLEKVMSSVKGAQMVHVATSLEGGQLPQITCTDPAVNNRVWEVASITSLTQVEQPNPKPPDLLSEKSKEKVPAVKQPLSKSAKKKLRKQVREQALCSFSRRGK
ncbi:hypothetical protein RHGRI_007847 [Rhododendron griersonianum]|uniref:Uncharacterized protein n=1 Tax=Rhododendron griersonianum TaxID=479676 RepID=A0AAV6KZN9_9ERIC|nr:hypothetical protein RHGRI_007847 [Rhododendron griersonianum]